MTEDATSVVPSTERHTTDASTVPAAMKVAKTVTRASGPLVRVLVLVVVATLLIMIGLPWLLAAGAAAAG